VKLTKEERRLARDTPFEKGELKKLRQLVAKVKGTTNDDELSQAEFRDLFYRCTKGNAESASQQEVNGINLDDIFKMIDTDNGGTVDFKELVLWLAIFTRGSEESKLVKMFEVMDTDDSGALEEPEFDLIIKKFHETMERNGQDPDKVEHKARRLLKLLDQDGDGEITLEEWISLGKRCHLVELLLGKDFMDLMKAFSIPGGEKYKPKPYLGKKGIGIRRSTSSGGSGLVASSSKLQMTEE